MRPGALVAWLALVAGCTGGAPTPSGARSQALGEQQNGFPSPWERAVLMAANRARSDPSTVKGAQSTIYPAQPPLVLEYDLERSARFHATMLETGMAPLMHESPCTLKSDVGTSGCDGHPACGCTTGTTCNSCDNCPAGTSPFTRIQYFYAPGGDGEVAAAGYGDPWGVMDGWVDEAAGSDGHRMLIDSGAMGLVGFGHAEGGGSSACWPTFDVGDLASSKPTPAKLASAAPKPIGGAAGTYRIYATWSDPAGGAPLDLYAVVDGTCTAMMTKELGDPAKNATYDVDVPLGSGCHSVYVVGRDAAGTRWSYPTTTAFTIAVGGGSCAEEMAQPASSCGDAGTDGGVSGGGDGGGSAGGGDDGGVLHGGGDAAMPGGGPADHPGGARPGLASGGCSLAADGHASDGSAFAFACLGCIAALALARPRARRRAA